MLTGESDFYTMNGNHPFRPCFNFALWTQTGYLESRDSVQSKDGHRRI